LAAFRSRIAPIGLDPITGFLRDQGRRHDLALDPVSGQVAMQPVATRPGFIHHMQHATFALQRTNGLVDVALASANVTQRHHFAPRQRTRVRHGDRLLVNIQTHK
jgi:hypothetical protein